MNRLSTLVWMVVIVVGESLQCLEDCRVVVQLVDEGTQKLEALIGSHAERLYAASSKQQAYNIHIIYIYHSTTVSLEY